MKCTSFLAHTHRNAHSGRQQGPVSDHDGARVRGATRPNDLRHMSSPRGFKTKRCQERSALAGYPAPPRRCVRRAAGDTLLRVQDQTYHRPFHIVPFFLQTAGGLGVHSPPLSNRPRLSGCCRFACEARWGCGGDGGGGGSVGVGHDTLETESIHITPLQEKPSGGPGMGESEAGPGRKEKSKKRGGRT